MKYFFRLKSIEYIGNLLKAYIGSQLKIAEISSGLKSTGNFQSKFSSRSFKNAQRHITSGLCDACSYLIKCKTSCSHQFWVDLNPQSIRRPIHLDFAYSVQPCYSLL